MYNKYSQPINTGLEHGFPHKSGWDDLFEELAPRGNFNWFKEITEELDNGRVRVRSLGDMLMLSGYSYLGLNKHPGIQEAAIAALEKYGTGTAGSRWLAGHTQLHEQLETLLAELHGTDDAVVFSSGYVANVSTISALVGSSDLVISDKFNHASILDGCRYSGANFQRYRFNDVDHLQSILKRFGKQTKRRMVVVDGVFSMSGKIVDIPPIVELCKKYDAALMVDECHSHFVLGKTGGGIKEYFELAPKDITIEMGTLSKAIPANGGYIAASSEICGFIRREARGFLYSGSLSCVLVATAIRAIELFMENRKDLVRKITANLNFFRSELQALGHHIPDYPTPIVPIPVGSASAAANAATICQQNGVFIHSVSPPVVPSGGSILRASIIASHKQTDLKHAVQVITDAVTSSKN